jgi:serine/threonine-protein kinase HipA
MSKQERNILVYSDWESLSEPLLMGILSAVQIRGKEVFSFEYDKIWLKNASIQLDPDLHFYAGRQFLQEEKSNFGIFMDSSPDRWGRLLMRRREAALARKEQRKETLLLETDYLLGVYDQHRMGAMRFKTEENTPFQNNNKAMAAPPFTSLRELEQASLKLEDEDSPNAPEYLQWLNMLMAPGSSLGGARPKASVVDTSQNLWIAKFPSKYDDKNMGAWEKVTHELALKSGINMADAFIEKYGSRHHTFITKRFDRINEKRIHFASAMTLLGYTDGADYQDGVSYLALAEFILRNGSHVESDLEELWRRIIFSIYVSNTDDHLRNHGFILTPKGWQLSPAYDINPNENGSGLKLNINENDNTLEIDLAMEVAPFFRVKLEKAKEIQETVSDVVKNWRKFANKYQIPRNEQELMSRAFQNA